MVVKMPKNGSHLFQFVIETKIVNANCLTLMPQSLAFSQLALASPPLFKPFKCQYVTFSFSVSQLLHKHGRSPWGLGTLFICHVVFADQSNGPSYFLVSELAPCNKIFEGINAYLTGKRHRNDWEC